MEAYLRNRLTMLKATLAHFDGHAPAWSAHAPLVRNVDVVRDGVEVLEGAAGRQTASNPKGLTVEKRVFRGLANGRLARLGQKASAYALETGDADFRLAVDHSVSDWARMAEADFFSHADDALARMEAALPALGEYGVEAAEVDEARRAVDDCRGRTAARDNVRADRVAATDDLAEAYSALVPTLDVLDRLVPSLVDDPAFVAEYAVVRRIPGD